MLNLPRKLTELVRILEERDYIFPADPAPLTDLLRHVDESDESRLIRRAEMMDRDGRLKATLESAQMGTFWLWIFAAGLLFCSGFSATYLLMDSQGLNFFLILASVLGMNTLMLLVWLVSLVVRLKISTRLRSPATWWRGKDTVNQAVFRLYTEQWQQKSVRWIVGATSHSLWLATLSGMLVSVLLLLLVRQYTFNWESTLLTDGLSVKAIEALSWLPAQLGFSVPDADAVLHGRGSSNVDDARAWSGLLLGSITAYGIAPRLLAWLACKIMQKASSARLPLDKPYYQHIIQKWHTEIVDADTETEAVERAAAKIRLSDAEKWAVMLETEWVDKSWFINTLGKSWLLKPTADRRERLAALLAELQQNRVQLLIGVRAQIVPDRGVLRQIVQLAEAAEGGAIVQLLAEQQYSDGIEPVLRQWHDALNERNIAWLNPPQAVQRNMPSENE